MFRPSQFRVDDPRPLAELIRECPFATLVTSADDGEPFASHVPLLYWPAEDGGKGMLIGHVARGNPQWLHWDGEREALAIFHGPHAYVSPSWYAEHPSVPTWNYAVVHVYGRPRAVREPEAVWPILEALVDAAEAGRQPRWRPELPEDYRQRMVAGVVAMEMPVTRMEGKYKLSQNRSPAERERVIAALDAEPDPEARSLGAFMRRHEAIVFGAARGAHRTPERQS